MWILKKIPYEPTKFLAENNIDFAAYIFEQRLKNGSPHSGHLATRTNLYEFLLSYMNEIK